ncbi:MAG: lipopolysaccharide assembly protein LapA domain-containing protein [Desulfuromonadales bacterium]|uniref:lipopolysaccharide assembly protein LapA domain-containing protein n=1 Tax=Desulfuromonas sp. KJ2020 TaxID=2919173 RepID=UPI0020A6FE19|nr:lipopolysaccharide assembly protein LapA domain-containing protein [Desulfuromonas sp. KJ2020]
MKSFKIFLLIVVLVALFVFSLNNTQMVKVAFVGFETPEIPLFLIVLFIFALGFLLGLLVASLEMIRLRREATQARKALVNAQAGAKLSEPEPPSSSSAEVN